VKRLLLVFAAFVAALLSAPTASAEVSLQTRVSTKRPEIGESFTLQLTA
jgi:hypothetical protein